MPGEFMTRSVSIILPVRNEATYIQRSLGSVLAQEYPDGFLEILVVDGMSDDGTREIVQKIAQAQEQIPVHIINNSQKITVTALNHGIHAATGEIIIRVDGHCEIAPDYVRRCVAYLQTSEVDAVGGSMETIGEGFTGRVIALAMSSLFGVGNSSFRTVSSKRLFVDSVPFPAYRRATIDLLGEYDEQMLCNEDDEYNYRLLNMGGRILQADDIRSRYYGRGSLYLLGRQYFRYGYWKVRVLQKHSRQIRTRQFIPFIFVSALISSLLIALFFPLGWALFAMTAGSYLLANITASMITAARFGWKYLILLPITFSILHISYGVGFLAGLIKFWNLWINKDGTTQVRSGDFSG
jgi:succinoglycan biosynthesis protein ExoA